jgi:hypothetical protein
VRTTNKLVEKKILQQARHDIVEREWEKNHNLRGSASFLLLLLPSPPSSLPKILFPSPLLSPHTSQTKTVQILFRVQQTKCGKGSVAKAKQSKARAFNPKKYQRPSSPTCLFLSGSQHSF